MDALSLFQQLATQAPFTDSLTALLKHAPAPIQQAMLDRDADAIKLFLAPNQLYADRTTISDTLSYNKCS